MRPHKVGQASCLLNDAWHLGRVGVGRAEHGNSLIEWPWAALQLASFLSASSADSAVNLVSRGGSQPCFPNEAFASVVSGCYPLVQED